MSAYDKVGSKSHTKDSNTIKWVLTSNRLNTQMKKSWLIRSTRKIMQIGIGIPMRPIGRRERVQDPRKLSYGHLMLGYYRRINKLVKIWNHWLNIFGQITCMFPLIKDML